MMAKTEPNLSNGTHERASAVLAIARAMMSRDIAANASKISLFVGSCLNAINQGPAIWSGAEIEWVKFLLNFLVPYLVASFSAAKMRQ